MTVMAKAPRSGGGRTEVSRWQAPRTPGPLHTWVPAHLGPPAGSPHTWVPAHIGPHTPGPPHTWPLLCCLEAFTSQHRLMAAHSGHKPVPYEALLCGLTRALSAWFPPQLRWKRGLQSLAQLPGSHFPHFLHLQKVLLGHQKQSLALPNCCCFYLVL